MVGKRKRYSAAFKAKVALEAIRGDPTPAELAAKHGVHYTMIAAWKRQAIDGMASTFSGAGDAAKAARESAVEKLHATACRSRRKAVCCGSVARPIAMRRCRRRTRRGDESRSPMPCARRSRMTPLSSASSAR